MLYSYSFRAAKNGETVIKTDCTSFSAIEFMMDCFDCQHGDECGSARFLRELREEGSAKTTHEFDGTTYVSRAWRNK